MSIFRNDSLSLGGNRIFLFSSFWLYTVVKSKTSNMSLSPLFSSSIFTLVSTVVTDSEVGRISSLSVNHEDLKTGSEEEERGGGVDDVSEGEKEGINIDSEVVRVVSAELFVELFCELNLRGIVGEKSNTPILFTSLLIPFSFTAMY